jgi:thioesterase domain-containing protein/acyl carrier protein
VADLPAGQYHYTDGALERISDDLVLRKHVIAINQQVYERSSIGITVMSTKADDWTSYVRLGRELQRLQMNRLNLGFMSSGYSSKTGNDLPSATRIASILRACGREAGPSYFFVGGRVASDQLRSEGMNEDVVHMRGPAEIIKDDLVSFLPDYMIPNRVIILDSLPRTVNGKIDMKALADLDVGTVDRPFVEPRTETEVRLCDLWKAALKCEAVSVRDDFFELGGNSLLAVSIVNKVNKAFGSSLPLQVLFEAPTIEKLASTLDDEHRHESSRLVALRPGGSANPIFCWPGLGGYPMNLRLLANRLAMGRPFYGVQAHGVNADEVPYRTIEKMAAEDVRMIRRVQPSGPYMLLGYSFGARVAFEAAHQLEQAGEEVDHVFLIAPGSPKVGPGEGAADTAGSVYSDRRYVSILFSVFAGSISHPLLEECLSTARDEDSFVSFIDGMSKELGPTLIRRIVRIVERTYQSRYVFDELDGRRIDAPVTIFKAKGDDYSFIEGRTGYCTSPPTFVNLDVDHYGVLKDPGVGELVRQIHERLRREFDWADGAAA